MSDITPEQVRASIIPKSDQFNYDDFIAGPHTYTIAGVSAGTSEQPVNIRLEGEKRFYRPSKTMRRVLVLVWGENGHDWVGRQFTLYGDPGVKFGGVAVGGIKISHMSHIKETVGANFTATRGKKEVHTVKPLASSPRGEGGGTHGAAVNNQVRPRDEATAEPTGVDVAAIETRLYAAASKGSDILKAEWVTLHHADREAMGGTCPRKFKKIAEESDDFPGTRRDVGGNEMTTLDAG